VNPGVLQVGQVTRVSVEFFMVKIRWLVWNGGMETNPEMEYLRKRLDELWSEVYEKGNPTACGLAELRGWRSVIDDVIRKLDERVFALGLEGIGKRLERIERQQDSLQAILARLALAPHADVPQATPKGPGGRRRKASPQATE